MEINVYPDEDRATVRGVGTVYVLQSGDRLKLKTSSLHTHRRLTRTVGGSVSAQNAADARRERLEKAVAAVYDTPAIYAGLL